MQFICHIARGGFGSVDEVTVDSERLARKTFDPAMPVTPEQRTKLRARFAREVQVQAALPNEVALPVIDSDLSGDKPWFVMPLADQNYRTQIDSDRAGHTVSQAPLADILNALEELHALGYVHRDLKPENILLHEGVWKLSDFGLVLAADLATSRLTSTGSAFGTQMYAPPEATLGSRDATAAWDLYSFGCMLHDLSSGDTRIPFDQHTCQGPLGPIVERLTDTQQSRRALPIKRVREVLFQALSTGSSEETLEERNWRKSLEEINEWSTTIFAEFVQFIRRSTQNREVLHAVEESHLRALHDLDAELWATLAAEYAEWVDRSGFDFGLCDVLIDRVEVVIELAAPRQRVAAILAAAQLADSHNRWFVMRRVLAMCGDDLDSAIARRLGIELRLDRRYNAAFRACADRVSESVERYHPELRDALQSFNSSSVSH